MVKCYGCGREIEGDYMELVEVYKDERVGVSPFHGYRCLSEFLLDRSHFRIVVKD